MSGLFQALLIGAALSLLSGLLALVLASWQTRRGAGGSGLWRTARWAALTPLLLAPIIYSIPDTVSAPMHAPLPGGALPSGDMAARAQAGPGPVAILAAIDWRLPLAGTYLAGLLVALAGAALRHGRRALLLAGSRPAPEIAQDYLSMLAARVGVETPDFRLRDGLASPLLTGWNPVILAAPDLLDDTAASRYALTHELVHYRRGDEQDRLLGAALMVALWFHWPLRRIERELHEAREIDCDAESLEALGGAERKPYAATLITMMRSPAQLVSAFGPDDRRHREMRIKAILSGRSARPSSRLLAVMLAGVSILPVACAQAALTERSQLVVDLNNPAENHVVRFHAAPNGDPELHDDDELHFEPDPHGEHAFGPDHEGRIHDEHESDGIDGHRVFRTEDGREIIFEPREGSSSGDVAFMDGEGSVEFIFLEPNEGEEPRYAMIDDDGNVTRFDFEPGNSWVMAGDGDSRAPRPDPVTSVAPTAPVQAEPGLEPAPEVEAVEPAATPRAAPRPDGRKHAAPADAAVPAPAFTHTVADGRISSRFGPRRAPAADISSDHHGTDIAAASGTPIRAPGAGTIVHAEAGLNGWPAWGNTVVIDHGAGWETVYAHMQGFDVEVGDHVEAGQQIGRVGSTGRSTGPHVHVELRRNGERIDPASRLPGLR
ncbi:M23/M56 family metallopeptidase [Maricaulis maris]|uniref:Murein DD-endopeptidase MepM/ murein hydrolase activator NlpD n=1 Tax=Maricaulis maris TaxID=74318 RepID=A0A495DDH9_9PROT|nr:M23/M56 family metallopeptidase [Maricaulis maris]RKR00362.1 murein DD-endopeptidase MepM/ murein hydrolase activator NlpD [Maricaulis maris]